MGYRPQSEDTSQTVERLQFDVYRGMTPAQKIERIRALCRGADELSLAGLRHRHPDETQQQLRWRLAAMRLGDGLARKIAARFRG